MKYLLNIFFIFSRDKRFIQFIYTFLYPIILPDKVSKKSAQILRKIYDFHIISWRNFSKSEDKRRRKNVTILKDATNELASIQLQNFLSNVIHPIMLSQ